MKPLLRFIISIHIALVWWPVVAQEDSDVAPIGNAVDISLDYLKLGSFALDTETKLEAEAGVLIKGHYRLAFAYGYSELKPDSSYQNGIYEAEGTYMRFGVDYQLSINPKNKVLLGLRYGTASFDDLVSGEIQNSIFGNTQFESIRKDLQATWYEFSVSSETGVLPRLFLGWRVRVKFLQEFDKPDNINPYSIPGYGHHFDKSIPALNLYIKYLIPF